MLIILTSQKKHPYFSNVESEREICTGFEKKNDARARGKETYLILEYHSCIVIAHYYLSRSVSRYLLIYLRTSRVIMYGRIELASFLFEIVLFLFPLCK